MAGVRPSRSPLPLRTDVLGLAASLPLLACGLLGGTAALAEESTAPATTAQQPTATPQEPAAAPQQPIATPQSQATPQTPATQQPTPTQQSPAGATPTQAGQPVIRPPAGSGPPPQRPLRPAPDSTDGSGPVRSEPRVLVSEIKVRGLDGHPERERLQQAISSALSVVPGMEVTRSDLRADLQAIYATGWFSDVRMEPVNVRQGVRLVVTVVPNPVLKKITIDPADALIPAQVIDDTFAGDLDRTLNIKTLQSRIQELQKWYGEQGYSLARVNGPTRVSPEGEVQLQVRQGTVAGVEVQFLNKEGEATNEKGQEIRGKTREWVLTREISLKTGEVFNRRNLEDDIKRLYGTGLFSDVKVTLRPEPANPGAVTIVLGVVEQSTGSLSGGLGYSQSQGVFGQIQVQDSNLFGRAWDLATSFTYGQFGGLADITFTDPWIRGDRFRTALRLKAFVSRDVPQIFQSQDQGNIYTVEDFYRPPGTDVAYNIYSNNNPTGRSFDNQDEAIEADDALSWFDYNGNTVVIQRIGGSVQVVRPLNGGNPFRRAPWSVVLGLNAQQVTPMNFSGGSQRYGVATTSFNNNGGEVPADSILCLAYNCASQNQLVGVRLATTMNTLDDPRNPTRGNFLSLGTEQFISVGADSPTFNRLRGSFTHYIPVKWLKLYKGCRPNAGQGDDCKQALAFQVSAGTNIGNLPPYEAFCVGGGNSVRGFYDCNLGVGRSFGEATVEYRFPIFSIVSGEVFLDGGTTFGSQASVPGNPGELLNKPGEGFSVGTGLIVTTPVGPLRLEVASRDLSGDWRFNLGVGWKF